MPRYTPRCRHGTHAHEATTTDATSWQHIRYGPVTACGQYLTMWDDRGGSHTPGRLPTSPTPPRAPSPPPPEPSTLPPRAGFLPGEILLSAVVGVMVRQG